MIELFDTNDQLKTIHSKQDIEKYRRKKYHEYTPYGVPSNIPYPHFYSHNLSYFNDYGFEDKHYNTHTPIFRNCNDPASMQYCEINDSDSAVNNITYSDGSPITFILMIRELKASAYYDELKNKLKEIILISLKTPNDLCLKLPCNANVFNSPGECTSDGYFNKIVNDFKAPPTDAKFGTFNMFPYSANF